MIEIPFSVWSALLITLVAVGVVIQYRILRILKQMNHGEPSSADMMNMDFENMNYKE